ncbi:MAG: multiprotein bridging factor aMBF1 [Candidatus Aenigmatarchaeota archaeon]
MECNLCGRETQKIFIIKVEGSQIEVCENCTKYGEIVGELKPKKKMEEKPKEIEIEPKEELIQNYGKIIIEARKKKGLDRKEFARKINERESIIKRVEMELMRPDDKLRKKIENFLEIKLTEIYEKPNIGNKEIKGVLTLGDIVEIK